MLIKKMIKLILGIGFLLSIPIIILINMWIASKELDEYYLEFDEFKDYEHNI
jgi:hypothetical protein